MHPREYFNRLSYLRGSCTCGPRLDELESEIVRMQSEVQQVKTLFELIPIVEAAAEVGGERDLRLLKQLVEIESRLSAIEKP